MPQLTYRAEPFLEIDGQPAPKALMEEILQLVVEESLHQPSMFTLVVGNAAQPGRADQKMWQQERHFAIGKAVRIGFKSSMTESPEFFQNENPDENKQQWVISGEITAIETHFTSGGQAPIIVRGYDHSHRLYRGRYNRSFQNMTDRDIVSKIIGEVGIAAGQLEDSGAAHDYVFQQNQTNIEFMRERAARNGFELFVRDGKLNFRKPKQDNSLELKWQKELTSFQVRVTSAEQVSSVEVRGWNYQDKKAIVASKSSATLLTETDHGKGQKTSSAFKGNPPSPKLIVVDQPVASQEGADKIAQALFNELGDEFVHADANAEGTPKIRPGVVVKLSGADMGKYAGNYYVTETRHVFSEGFYTTGFSVRGLRGGNLHALLSPQTPLQPGQTLLIGIVTNNKDPKGWGRVRVKLPTLTEEHESDWARVVAIGAGKDRGFDCLPEVNDEVLVGFEHGDIHRPFVIGGLWNGKDAPPEKVDDSVSGGNVRLRTVKTRTGHTLQFIEEDKGSSKKGVHLKSVYGHEIYLNDSDQVIEIKTKGGHKVRLDDRGKQIEIKTSGGHQYSMNDISRSISVESTGSMTLKANTTLDLQATGIVTVKGSLIRLN